MYQYMKKDDWLTNYQYKHGIKKALNGIGKRIKYSDNFNRSMKLIYQLTFTPFAVNVLNKCLTIFATGRRAHRGA